MSKFVFLDYEYNSTTEPNLHVICGSFLIVDGGGARQQNFWLLDEEDREYHKAIVESLMLDDYIFVSYHVPAEARSLLSLGIDPLELKWIDLAAEYRMLLNHNHSLSTGMHLIKGKPKRLYAPKPKWERTEDDPKAQKAEVSLAACTYRLLGIDINLGHKDEMRDLILSKKEFTDDEKIKILDYCDSDIKYLPKLLKRMIRELKSKYSPKDRRKIKQDMLLRGNYGARTAKMESLGYPIDYEATRSFSNSVKPLLFEMQTEIQADFSSITPFLIDKKGEKYTQKQKNIRAWVETQKHENWLRTDQGELSLSLNAFERYYSSKGDQTNFGNRFIKYLRTKQSLNGFMPARKGKTLWDYVGSDERVRPYFGTFVAQSSRSQPSATSYILLKSSWMRCLIQPEPGRAIVAIDYSQQEFLIAALLSQDPNMIKAYESGDVYLYTGKLAKAIPEHGTKDEFPELRDKFKSTVLGIQYLMGHYSLASKLTMDTGIHHSSDDAEELIELFNEAYPDYAEYRDGVWDDYLDDGYIRLNDGWTMFGDNHNRRSVCNMPIQGAGAAIMRQAVALAQDSGLEVIMTLHDALYIECDSNQWRDCMLVLEQAMRTAFTAYFQDQPRILSCRMDPTVWSPDFNDELVKTHLGPVKTYSRYIDGRSFADYQKYKKYFTRDADLALIDSLG